MSAAFLTAPKLPEVFFDKTVRLCEPVLIQVNETIEATKLQPLTKDSMEQQRSTDDEQGGLTNNGELETCDGQLLLIQHQPRLRTYLTVL